MKHQTITVGLRAEDAEPILREAAYEAARYGALCDYMNRRTAYAPEGMNESFDEARERWHARFLKGKRMVEAFGVDYEQTSEGETLTVYVPDKVLKSKVVALAGGLRARHILKSEPDYKNAMPAYRQAVHSEACHQAAERVVRRWRATLTGSI